MQRAYHGMLEGRDGSIYHGILKSITYGRIQRAYHGMLERGSTGLTPDFTWETCAVTTPSDVT